MSVNECCKGTMGPGFATPMDAFKKSEILLIDPDIRSTYSLPAQSACVLSWSASRWCCAEEVLDFLDLECSIVDDIEDAI